MASKPRELRHANAFTESLKKFSLDFNFNCFS